ATTVTPPGQFLPYAPFAHWLFLDLVEAAVHLGLTDAARRHVEAARAARIALFSPRLAMHVGAGAGLVASDPNSIALFEAALALPGSQDSPFDYARVQLLYGERLRRMRATTEARVVLSAATDTFRRLGAVPW